MTLSILISTILSFLSLFLKRSKTLAFLIFILCFLLFGWNEWNGDYDMYEDMYNFNHSFPQNFYELGYWKLSAYFLDKGFSFNEYLVFFSFFIIVLYGRFIFKLSNFPAIVAFLYFIVYFPLDYVLLRNTLAFGIILQGIYMLIEQKKYGKIGYILLVLIAWSIHFSAIIYIFFIIGFIDKKLDQKKIFKYVLFSFLGYLLFRTIFVNIFVSANAGKFNVYNNTIIQFIIFSIIQFFNFILISYLIGNRKEKKYIYLFNINLLMLFLIIFYYDMSIFIRVFRNLSFLNLVLLPNFLLKEKNIQKIFIFFLYMILMFIAFIYPVTDKSLYPLFYNNFIFK